MATKRTPLQAQAAFDSSRFASVDHLNHEAIAAFVDGELSRGAARRAQVHLTACRECRAEVHAQRRARTQLRRAAALGTAPGAPQDLLARLASIADCCPQGPTAEESLPGLRRTLSKVEQQLEDSMGKLAGSLGMRLGSFNLKGDAKQHPNAGAHSATQREDS